jgi:hypothetical protein
MSRVPWRPVPFALVVAAFFALRRGADVDVAAPNASTALADVLAKRGLACDPDDVVWTQGASGVRGAILGGARALVRAAELPAGASDRARTPTSSEPSDLYLVEARLSPEGSVLEVGTAYNLTDTSSVDESRPLVRGTIAAYTASADGLVAAAHTIDLAGRPPGVYADFTRTQRMQVALTNLQQTGQTSGIVHDTFALDPAPTHALLAWQTDGSLAILADDRRIVVDVARADVREGATFVRTVRDERAKPGNLVTWGVDRVRALPWFGDEKMQWVKAVAFTGLDWVNARFAKATTAQDVKEELGQLNAGETATTTFTDPEIGWPPAPIKPVISPVLPGEGEWIALDKDPFVTQTPGAPAAFVTTFIRPNAKRPDLRVYVTLWDPRQIAIHMESGTVEPVSATGEHGPGLIPRTPEVMRHVVAAFNGGFQAQHGEYGMMANGIEYLPPKPYAATVMELRDGSTAFGAWPGPSSPPAQAAAASGHVPSDVLAYRQNLTALVENDKFNPWGRVWWGGTPPGWGDTIHSARSAICLTKDDFVGYFYSASIAPEDLAAALLAARCAFGIHLDMNPGHAGFEFYNVQPALGAKVLGRPLQTDWEADGKVPGMPDLVFRARRMIRGMGHMLFPRYIQRESRDFFYLTTRVVLPGPAITAAGAGATAEPDGRSAPEVRPGQDPAEGVWRVKGLPQHGFPYALATTWVRPRADLKLRVVRADPRTMKPMTGASAEEPDGNSSPSARRGQDLVVLAMNGATRATEHGALTLWWSSNVFAIGTAAPSKDATSLVVGESVPSARSAGAGNAATASTARAAVGVQDEDGMLTWVELPPEVQPDASTTAAMDALLDRLGCSTRMLVGGNARALLGGTLDAAGNPAGALPPPSATSGTVRLVRAHAPGAHAMFEDTPVVPSTEWQPLQAKRVRYIQKAAPPPPPAAGSTPAAPSPATPPATSGTARM